MSVVIVTALAAVMLPVDLRQCAATPCSKVKTRLSPDWTQAYGAVSRPLAAFHCPVRSHGVDGPAATIASPTATPAVVSTALEISLIVTHRWWLCWSTKGK